MDLAGLVWRIGLPLVVLLSSIAMLVSVVRARGKPSSLVRPADWFLALVWLKLAGDAAFGDQRPALERQWKGAAALLFALAAAIHLGKYLRWRGRDTPAPAPALVPAVPASDRAVLLLMPRLGEAVAEGTVTRWLKRPGDTVVAGEPVVEISTDKVDTELPANASGTLLEIRIAAGQVAKAGAALAVIEPSVEAAAAHG